MQSRRRSIIASSSSSSLSFPLILFQPVRKAKRPSIAFSLVILDIIANFDLELKKLFFKQDMKRRENIYVIAVFLLFVLVSERPRVCMCAREGSQPTGKKRVTPFLLSPFFPLPSLSVASIAFLPSLKWRIKPRGGAEKTLRRGREGKGGKRELCAQKIESFCCKRHLLVNGGYVVTFFLKKKIPSFQGNAETCFSG